MSALIRSARAATRRTRVLRAVARWAVFLLAGVLPIAGHAQSSAATAGPWPARAVRLVVPFTPGGTNDVVARVLGRELAEAAGQSFVVDNRPGASGVLGAEIVARAPADGYTLMVHSVSHIANAFAYRKLPYDTLRDFEPLALLAGQPGVLVVPPSLPAKTLQAFLGLARARPGELAYASNGEGGSLHVQMAVLAQMAGIRLVHVPYKGGAPAMMSLVSGETQAGTITIGVALPQIRAGRLRALAVTAARRSALLPEVPTVAESGLPGYEMNPWTGLFAPAGLPGSVADRLLPEVGRVIRRPEFTRALTEQFVEPWIATREEFAARIRVDFERYERYYRMLGIQPS